jgi:hypothetical protein
MAIELSSTSRRTIFFGLNALLWVGLLVGAAAGGGSLDEFLYVALLFAICTSPIPYIDRLNGRYAMLGVAMAMYFVMFAAANAAAMLSPPKGPSNHEGLIDAAEFVLLVGAVMKVVGFHMAVGLTKRRRADGPAKDWPRGLLMPAGLLLWAIGCAAAMYQNLVLQVDNSDIAVAAAYGKLGAWGTMLWVLVTTYAAPLGIIILSYWWVVWGKRASTMLMLCIIVAQFVVGWLVDTKEVAINAPVIMLLTRFVVRGKVPVRWLVGVALGIVLIFPIMTAKRVIMMERLEITRAEAVARTWEIVQLAISQRSATESGVYGGTVSQSFLERVSDKGAVETFVGHVGKDKPYKMGATLDQLLYVFIPRVVWSDKPGENSAQTFNRDFHLSEDPDTHMSPTHLGELYWNFGLPGVVLGMLLSGALLGYICTRFDLSERATLTRVLIIILTLYELVAREEGQIELQYVVWIRALLLVGVLHLLFDRSSEATPNVRDDAQGQGTRVAKSMTAARFPNLMS